MKVILPVKTATLFPTDRSPTGEELHFFPFLAQPIPEMANNLEQHRAIHEVLNKLNQFIDESNSVRARFECQDFALTPIFRNPKRTLPPLCAPSSTNMLQNSISI
jgi:hypothetical protein